MIPSWIKCSERMPPQYAEILFVWAGEICFGYLIGGSFCKMTEPDADGNHDYYPTHEVEFWMPLPEPPP